MPCAPRGLGCGVSARCRTRTCQENGGEIKPPTLILSPCILLDVITAVTAGGISGCEIAKCNVGDAIWFQICIFLQKQFFSGLKMTVCFVVMMSVFLRGGKKTKYLCLPLVCIIAVFSSEESGTSRSWSPSLIAMHGDGLQIAGLFWFTRSAQLQHPLANLYIYKEINHEIYFVAYFHFRCAFAWIEAFHTVSTLSVRSRCLGMHRPAA